MQPTMMVQNLPAKESAMRAPMIGVRLEVPLKLVRVLEACTNGKFSTWVRYVIMLALKPLVANLSQTSFAEIITKTHQLIICSRQFVDDLLEGPFH